METKNKNFKKKIMILIIVLITVCTIIGISYAYWSSKADQTTANKVKSDCLKIELTNESSEINLESAFPIRDEEAEDLTPYTFTIENACSSSVYYKLNLEIMGEKDETDRLASKYIAVDLNDTGKKLLSDYTSVEPTYKDETYTAVESRELIEYGILDGGASSTYSLKLWMDESVTIEDDAMNKYFTSKISVVASQETFLPQLARYIVDLAKTDTTNLVYDGTTDNNLRYIGADPDNYLCFDKDCTSGKWRVIGVMNNMTTSDEETKSLVKIIRNESIGSYAWNSNDVNNWTAASLKTYLNGSWYTSYLTNYDDLVESVVWHLGGYNTGEITANAFYAYERGTTVYSGRPTTWTGKVALIYPSDYGYATSGGSTTNRETCLLTALYNWNSTDPDIIDCKNNDFLFDSSNWQWLLTPNSSASNFVSYVVSDGGVGIAYRTSHTYLVRPSLYLKSDTQILSGDGTSDNPWIIGEDSVK
jgi:flagellar basal body-associated protein FliL